MRDMRYWVAIAVVLVYVAILLGLMVIGSNWAGLLIVMPFLVEFVYGIRKAFGADAVDAKEAEAKPIADERDKDSVSLYSFDQETIDLLDEFGLSIKYNPPFEQELARIISIQAEDYKDPYAYGSDLFCLWLAIEDFGTYDTVFSRDEIDAKQNELIKIIDNKFKNHEFVLFVSWYVVANTWVDNIAMLEYYKLSYGKVDKFLNSVAESIKDGASKESFGHLYIFEYSPSSIVRKRAILEAVSTIPNPVMRNYFSALWVKSILS